MSEKELKKLVPGETVIATFPQKDEKGLIHKYTVYYGNIVSPAVDGKYKPIKKDRYMKMLKEFLESEEGLDYDIPTDEEIEDANIQMENRRTLLIAHKEKEEKQQRALVRTQQLESFDEEYEDDDSEEMFEKEKKGNIFTRIKESRKEREPKELSQNALNAPYRLLLALLLLSLLLNGFLAYTAVNLQSQRARLNINEETYEIPISDLNLREGETVINIYGITTTVKDGEEIKTAIPLGELNLNVKNR